MFEVLEVIIKSLTDALYSQSATAIAAMCGWAWTNLFGWIAGLALGFTLLQMLLEDNLFDGLRRFVFLVIVLMILAWFIKPGSVDGCKMVQVKNDALAMRASITDLIAPGWGGDPGQSIQKTAEQMRKHMDLLIRAASQTLVMPHEAEVVAGRRDPLTDEERATKAAQPVTCADLGVPDHEIYCR